MNTRKTVARVIKPAPSSLTLVFLLFSSLHQYNNRSLVQIKSHAQKVLKRQEAGEDIYRKLEETDQSIIDQLVVQSCRERDALRVAGINCNTTKPSRSLIAAAKQQQQKQQQQQQSSSNNQKSIKNNKSQQQPKNTNKNSNKSEPPKNNKSAPSGPESVIAAAALCQLSSTSGLWDQV